MVLVCNHCPYVRHVERLLGEIVDAADGLRTVGINSNDTVAYPEDGPSGMREQIARARWTFPYLIDDSQDLARAFGAACTPDFFLYDKAGRLAYRGAFDTSTPKNGEPLDGHLLREAISKVVAGEPFPNRTGHPWVAGSNGRTHEAQRGHADHRRRTGGPVRGVLCRIRGFSTIVCDTLPEIGGQISAMYPEKLIFDVAGFPAVRGRDLVEGLAAQAETYRPSYVLGEQAMTLEHTDDGVRVTTSAGTVIEARFCSSPAESEPSNRALPAADAFTGEGIVFFVPKLDVHAGHDVVIVGVGIQPSTGRCRCTRSPRASPWSTAGRHSGRTPAPSNGYVSWASG